MPLPSFSQWRESRPSTRNKWAAAMGLQPMYSADVFGHATPPPAITKRLLEKLKKEKKSGKDADLPESSLEEKVMTPNYEIDDFIRKAKKITKQIADDKADGDKKAKDLDDKKAKKQKELEDKRKAKKPVPPGKPEARPHFPFKSPIGAQADPDKFDDEEDGRTDIEKQNEQYNWEALL